MPQQTVPFYACNRGEVSRLALMRVDVEKLRLAATVQENWLPLTMGPMTIRPGTAYVGETNSDNPAKFIEFIYSSTDTALLELTNSALRMWVDDALVTRVAVSSTIQAWASWTTTASPGATVSTGGGQLSIAGVTQGHVSSAYGAISVSGGDQGKEHGLRIVVTKGPILFRLGTTVGGSDVISSTSLEVGTHSLAFTPSVGTLYAQFDSRDYASHVVSSIAIESAGAVSLPTPWLTSDLPNIQYDQSADVVFVTCKGQMPRRIERRSTNGWSIVLYRSADGPFPSASGDSSFSFTPAALYGDTTITCNNSFFNSSHVGALLRLFHIGQNSGYNLNAENTWTKPIRVAGLGTGSNLDRVFYITITGAFTGKISLQRTFDVNGLVDWVTVGQYTVASSATINDGLTNVIAYYRVGFATGDYTSGSPAVVVAYVGGGGAGIARIESIASATVANVEVIEPFYNITGATDWRFSEWNSGSSGVGWPASAALHEGRLWLSGANRVWGSVSDNYSSFDFEKTGDAAPIARSIGKGPIANSNWLLSLGRLAIGLDSGVVTARSNSFDEPLTPTVFNLKYSTTQGCAPVRALSLDQKGVFVQRSNRRIYMMEFSTQVFDYKSIDLTRLNLDIGIPGFVDFSIQRQPDTRMHFVRGDGQIASLTFDSEDDVQAWYRIVTDGVIENVMVLPGELEDKVYVCVKRTINGLTRRYLERFARLDECYGDTLCKLLDCHGTYSGAPTTTITGLGYLEGKSVAVWADGKEVGFDPTAPSVTATYTVSGGSITLPVSVSNAVVGLPYKARFVSAKLAYAAAEGTAINQPKRVDHLGFILDRTHYQGVRFAQYNSDPSMMQIDDMPLIEDGAATNQDTIWPEYDQQQVEFPGNWDTNSKLYIESASPRPATVLGFSLQLATSG